MQSSVRRALGLKTSPERNQARPAERGVADMMVSLYRSFSEALSHDVLFDWHRALFRGRRDVKHVGAYRTGTDPMQVVSGPVHDPTVHFEAPPSRRVPKEMDRFVAWFNRTAPTGTDPLPALTRAGVAHLYFESIHPFEDGNGRIGRTLSEKALAQSVGQPAPTAIATAILARRRAYYDALEAANTSDDITEWLAWFAAVSLEAQRRTDARVSFVIEKTRLLDRLQGQLNARQEKALMRVLREGPEGFTGGLSAGNYSTMTGALPATATRDLADMTAKGALVSSFMPHAPSTGEARGMPVRHRSWKLCSNHRLLIGTCPALSRVAPPDVA